MAKSFVFEDNNDVEKAESFMMLEKPSTLLSMIHYDPKETKEELFKDALSQCSKRSYSN